MARPSSSRSSGTAAPAPGATGLIFVGLTAEELRLTQALRASNAAGALAPGDSSLT